VTPNLIKERAYTATAATYVDRALTSIATVKAFNAQSYEQGVLAEAFDNIRVVAHRSFTIWGIQGAITQFLGLAMLVLGLWYGATLVSSRKLSVGDVMTVYWACLIIATSIRTLSPHLITIAKGKIAIASLVELIESQPKPDLNRSISTHYTPLKPNRRTSTLRQIVPTSYEGSIELINVTFTYPSRQDVKVLNDVSISIPAQKTTFIVGASGSGKSTIAQLLLRLYDLPRGSGTIRLGNEDLAYVDVNWCREQIASVTQSCILFDMTVHENVAMGVASPMSIRKPEDITREEVEEVCRATLMHGFICDLPDGYNTKLGNGGTSLSGGQKQRLAIARALLRDPAILILGQSSFVFETVSISRTALYRRGNICPRRDWAGSCI
jgi:ATP-binding cassette, subfamily B (MDR/TAP), member 1